MLEKRTNLSIGRGGEGRGIGEDSHHSIFTISSPYGTLQTTTSDVIVMLERWIHSRASDVAWYMRLCCSDTVIT